MAALDVRAEYRAQLTLLAPKLNGQDSRQAEASVANTKPMKGEMLKYLREAKGWTQSKLAREAGVAKRTIEHAEKGRAVAVDTINRICEALGKEPLELLADDARDPRNDDKLLEALVLDSMDIKESDLNGAPISVHQCGRVRRVEMCYEMLLAVEWPLRDLELFVDEVGREPRDADKLFQKIANSQFDFATSTRLIGFRQARHWPEFRVVFDEIRAVLDEIVNDLREARNDLESFWSNAPKLAKHAISRLLELNNRLKCLKSAAIEKLR